MPAFFRRRGRWVPRDERGYLAGTVEEVVYKAKCNELKGEAAKTDETLAKLGDVAPGRGETALALFDWTQRAADNWRGSNNAFRRQVLDAVCLNRTLTDVNLVTTMRKPCDVFVEGLISKNSRGNKTPLELFLASIASWPRVLAMAAESLMANSSA